MKNKLLLLILIALPVVLITTSAFTSSSQKTKTASANASNGFAVIELFTSEGCSSCPAAEETIARLLAKNKPNVYILSYHVDYWDKLGWKDQFSSAAFTQLQNQYAAAFNLNSIYTPQAVVNGSAEFVGSDEGRLKSAIDKNLTKEGTTSLSFDAKRNANLVTVTYEVSGNNKLQSLNIALVQPEATVAIKRGENGGRTLRHVNIVRVLKAIDAADKGSLTLEIPADIKAIPLQVIAYIQEKKTMHITAAEKLSL